MKNKLLFALMAAIPLCLAVGCGAGEESKATEEEKANIDRFVREGIKESDMAGGTQQKAPEGLPGNQPVDQTP
ncbi:MAG: hypothetical protein N2109_08285 [Fimbriimonadales bacterium]|nr:hypothetical protein [Fimbriimonadales bacterium]